MPKLIEDAIRERLTAEAQKDVLNFITATQENGFSYVGFDEEGGGWDPVHENRNIHGCVLVSDQFMFFVGLDCQFDEEELVDDELKEFAWSYTTICPQSVCKPPYCQGENHSKNRWQIFGKQYESTCHSPLQFIDPDSNTLENLLRLLLVAKQSRGFYNYSSPQ